MDDVAPVRPAKGHRHLWQALDVAAMVELNGSMGETLWIVFYHPNYPRQ
jgi:hypothetical protein